jgi:CRISPR-associated protein Cas1
MGMLYLLSEGSTARKVGPRIAVEKDGEIIGRLPVRSIDGVVIGRNAQMTTQVIFELLELSIPIIYIDDYGKIVGNLCNDKQTAARLLRQIEIFRNSEKQIILAREIISEKISNQQNLLKQYAKTKDADKLSGKIKRLKTQGDKINLLNDLEEIRGVEGMASKIYFSAFPELIDLTRWSWKGRTQHPATDPINALLNYGYAFLEREVRIAVALAGLDARIGFFHSNDGRKDALVFDLMEFFRQPVIDRFVLNLINRKMISPDDFNKTKDDCRLKFDAQKIWCTRYEEYMAKIYREYDDKNTRDVICKRVSTFAECLRR